MDETQAALIAEQLRHANTRLLARLDAIDGELRHLRELSEQRLRSLEDQAADHETRLRAAGEGVTQFKMWSGLANAGSSLVSVVALVRAFLQG